MLLRTWWYRVSSRIKRTILRAARYLAEISPNALVVVLAALVGIGAGLMAVCFMITVDLSERLFFSIHEMAQRIDGRWYWLLPTAPALGGLVVGFILYRVAKAGKGLGVPEVMDAVASHGGRLNNRVIAIKTLASAITIGSGGSAGQEVHIGAVFGSVLGRALQLSNDRMKVLVGCGAAGGIAAIFNAPIAGVLFTLELILGDFRIQTFSPVVVASVLASVVARSFLGSAPAFDVPEFTLMAPWELGNYLVLGAIAGVAAVAFTRMLYAVEDFFHIHIKVEQWLKPAIGGLIVGLIALAFPEVLGGGHHQIRATLHGEMLISSLIILAILKLIAASLTLGSGGSGGIYAPALFIGAMVGGLFGHGVAEIFPNLNSDATMLVGAYALVGMGAVVAATTHAWMTSVMMVFEMTDNYSIILPLMLATIVSMIVSRALNRESIYTEKLARSGRHVERGLDLALLSRLHVGDAMFSDYVYFRPDTQLTEIVETAKRARSYDFPVVAFGGNLVGMISLPDVAVAQEAESPSLFVAASLVSMNYTPLYPDESLESAMNKFDLYDRPTLPVVDRDDRSKIVGMLDRRQILNLHERVSLLGHPNRETHDEWRQYP